MFIDQINYRLADEITEEALHKAAEDIVDIWMKKQTGWLSWNITKDADGNYTDFVFWEDKAAADAATAAMKDIPADHPWTKCYDMKSISGKKLEGLFVFKAE